MMRMLLASAALLSVVAVSQPASAWTHVTFGPGQVFTWPGTDNSAPWGGAPGVPIPGQPGFDNSWGQGYGSPFAGVTFSNQSVAPSGVYGPAVQPIMPSPGPMVTQGNVPFPSSNFISSNVPRRMPLAPDQAPTTPFVPSAARPVSFNPYSYAVPGPMPFVDP